MSHEKRMIQLQIDATDQQIVRAAYEIYGFMEEKIKIVEDES